MTAQPTSASTHGGYLRRDELGVAAEPTPAETVALSLTIDARTYFRHESTNIHRAGRAIAAMSKVSVEGRRVSHPTGARRMSELGRSLVRQSPASRFIISSRSGREVVYTAGDSFNSLSPTGPLNRARFAPRPLGSKACGYTPRLIANRPESGGNPYLSFAKCTPSQ